MKLSPIFVVSLAILGGANTSFSDGPNCGASLCSSTTVVSSGSSCVGVTCNGSPLTSERQDWQDLPAEVAQRLILNLNIEVKSGPEGSSYAKLTGVISKNCNDAGSSRQIRLSSSATDPSLLGTELVGYRISVTPESLACLVKEAELRTRGAGSRELIKLGETFPNESRLDLSTAKSSGQVAILALDPTDEATPFKATLLKGKVTKFVSEDDSRKARALEEAKERDGAVKELQDQLAQCHDTREGIADEREILSQLNDLGVTSKSLQERSQSLNDREIAAIRAEIKTAGPAELLEIRERLKELARERKNSKRGDEIAAMYSEIAKRQVSFSGEQGAPDYDEAQRTLGFAAKIRSVSPGNRAALKKLGLEMELKQSLDGLRSGDPSLASKSQSDVRELQKKIMSQAREACRGNQTSPDCIAMKQVATTMQQQIPAAFNEGRIKYNQDQMDQYREAMGMNNALNSGNPYGPVTMGDLGTGNQNYMIGGLNWGGSPSNLNFGTNPSMNGINGWSGPQGLTQYNALGNSPIGQFQNQLGNFPR